ncbi:MAG: nucleotide sugar dehydrogenase [Holosporales bacterium]|jgi:UDPglucose 6-dehydrogenase|nr:nucleotide sugar dehydrogenase [Holosporales bacterium]
MLRITVLGGGYLGVVSAICFCECGFYVDIIEINPKRLKDLKNYIVSVYEPSFESNLKKHHEQGYLRFFEHLKDSHSAVDVIVIAVPGVGSDNLAVHKAIQDISVLLTRDKYTCIVINTITVVGTCSIIKKNMRFMRPDLTLGEHYDIVLIPTFLKEGYALHDFMLPSRLVIGMDPDSNKARELINKLHAGIILSDIPVVYTNHETAELIRYVTTAFELSKITLINEVSELCEKVGADIGGLITGVGLDENIGMNLLKVTHGYGGVGQSALIHGLIRIGEIFGVNLRIAQATIESNDERIGNIAKKIIRQITDGEINERKKVAILGLTYRPQTNEVRESPNIKIVEELLKSGITVAAYDPSLSTEMPDIRQIIPQQILDSTGFQLSASPYEAANQSNILVIMTSWSEFISIDFNKIAEIMNKKPNGSPKVMNYSDMFSKSPFKNFDICKM